MKTLSISVELYQTLSMIMINYISHSCFMNCKRFAQEFSLFKEVVNKREHASVGIPNANDLVSLGKTLT